MSENDVQARIMLRIGARPDVRIFRNTVGEGWMASKAKRLPDGRVLLTNPRYVTFGLAPGSSDLIGLKTVTVVPRMLGQRLAVFLAPEVKFGKAGARDNQSAFITMVQDAGGIAGVVRSPEDAEYLVESF